MRIAITGPESTGKSTLSAQLAAHYHAPWLPEYARIYIDQLPHYQYNEEDVWQIARTHIAQVRQLFATQPAVCFIDTELTVIRIWLQHAYGRVPDWIEQAWRQQTFDVYLLMDIDLPWQPDAQREHPHLRAYFKQKYQEALEELGVSYWLISGNDDTRFARARAAIDRLLYSAHQKQI